MMENHEDDYRPETYYIPQNFTEAGGFFGGRVGKRNAIELIVLCGPLAMLEYKILPVLFKSAQTIIIIAMFTVLPIAALCLFGIGGESVSQRTFAFIRFMRRRRILHYREFSIDKERLSGAESKIDKFFENVSSVGFVKALTELSESQQRTASDADRFDKKKEKESAKESGGKVSFFDRFKSKKADIQETVDSDYEDDEPDIDEGDYGEAEQEFGEPEPEQETDSYQTRSEDYDDDAEDYSNQSRDNERVSYVEEVHEPVHEDKWESDDYYKEPIEEPYYERAPRAVRQEDDYLMPEPVRHPKSQRQKQQKPKRQGSFTEGLLSAAKVERLLQAFELTDDDDYY